VEKSHAGTQRRKDKTKIWNSREKAQKAEKGGLEIWWTGLHCGAMDRLKLSASMFTALVTSYDSVSFELFVPFRGYLITSH
jgi:hypothetical protein